MILRATFLLPFLSLATLLPTQSPGAPTLDGTHWTVDVTPDKATKDKGEKAFKDTFIFENKKVHMTTCEKAGFGASEYTVGKPDAKKDDPKGGGDKSKPAPKAGASANANAWAFKTEQASDKEGKSVWTAEINGDAIKGKLVWTKKDGTELQYTFEGHKDAAKKEEPKKKEEPPKKDPPKKDPPKHKGK